MQLMPNILNGTSNSTKIGNQIRLKSLRVRGVLTCTISQTTANNTRFGVRLLILRAKRFSDYLQTTTDFATNYTRLLEGTNTGFLGSLAQFNTPINKDYFSVVMEKKYYITLSQGASTAEMFNTTKFINFTVPYSKRLLNYDENFDSDTPVNYPYVMLMGYTKLTGDAADGDGTTYMNFQYTSTASYEDA